MDRNTIIAMILIGVILFAMPYYTKLISPPKDETAQTESQSDVVTTDTNQESTSFDNSEALSGRDNSDQVFQETILDTIPVKDVIVETPLYRAVITTRGASFKSWILKAKQSYLKEEVQLIKQYTESNNNGVLIARGNKGILLTSEHNFYTDEDSVYIADGKAPVSIDFVLNLGEGRSYRETFTFYPDSYSVDIDISSNGLGNYTGAASVLYSWSGGLAFTEKELSQDSWYTEAGYHIGKKAEHFKGNGKKFKDELISGPPIWVGQRTKYFFSAFIPRNGADGVYLSSEPDSLFDLYAANNGLEANKRVRAQTYQDALQFNIIGGDIEERITLYMGPLQRQLLEKVHPDLVTAMSWGNFIIKPFSLAVFWLLTFLHNFIPNYGVILIIFSVLIKVIVWPLTQKSHQSMKRMQMLQPLIKANQEKYKDNPQKMQQEVMALYKEFKVNPAGGCWPMLLQMPLLFALFTIFRSTIELRGQAFFLWINDLSRPDIILDLPFNIPFYGGHIALLPLIMAGTTILQSKQTSSASDPNQKMMMYMMPVMLLMFFNNFPSGLTLYYTLFNVLSIVQQKYMKVSDPEIERRIAEFEDEQEKEAVRAERRKRKKQN